MFSYIKPASLIQDPPIKIICPVIAKIFTVAIAHLATGSIRDKRTIFYFSSERVKKSQQRRCSETQEYKKVLKMNIQKKFDKDYFVVPRSYFLLKLAQTGRIPSFFCTTVDQNSFQTFLVHLTALWPFGDANMSLNFKNNATKAQVVSGAGQSNLLLLSSCYVRF